MNRKTQLEHQAIVRQVPELNRQSAYGYVKFVKPELEQGSFWPCAYGWHDRCSRQHIYGTCKCACHGLIVE